MKLNDLLEGGSGSGRPDEGTRSKKNLWFVKQELWMSDIHELYGIDVEVITTDEEAEGDIYVTDSTGKQCFGVWRKELKQGISFAKPRPLSAVQNPRQRFAKMADAPVPITTNT